MQSKQNLVDFLLSSFLALKRVGPAVKNNLERLTQSAQIFDLLLHKPTHLEKIIINPELSSVVSGQLIAIKVKIEAHHQPAKSRQPYKILAYTPSGYITLVFFKIYPSQVEKLAIGNEALVVGHLQRSLSENQITHPQEILDLKKDEEKIKTLSGLDIGYSLVGGVTQKFLQQKIKEVFLQIDSSCAPPAEWINQQLLEKQGWSGFVASLKKIHQPQNEADFLPQNLARQRLAYDELLAWQIAMLLVRQSEEQTKTAPQIGKNLADEFLQTMPFKPTLSQLRVIDEIKQNMLSTKKMLRLLQGDVGSGKTVVAIYACLLAISAQKQACVIVPIATLAHQHFEYFKKMLQNFNLEIEILTSKNTKKQKAKILQDLRDGKIHILISTHAALQDDVIFKNLGVAIIDEQHRFGVMQRLKLVEKGRDVDVLLMSATPIPRSLMMAIYSDMDISILNEKPANRKNIDTIIRSQNKQEEIYDGIKRAIFKGDKVYWICAAIEESEEVELVSAQKKHEELSVIFGEKNVALLHGKMKEPAKEKVMESFVGKSSMAAKADAEPLQEPSAVEKNPVNSPKILVATTVIEVGIDVKDATIIVIENAEHFGLSQLHQLRGRVGRSDKQSYCILLYGKKYSTKARERLSILRQSNDGFFIAEEDLKLRGSGELLGTKQSGILEFKIADLFFDTELLKTAHKNAQFILNHDKNLREKDSQKYHDLLRLFNYDRCLDIINSG